MKINKKLIGAVLGIALTLTGCGLVDKGKEDTSNAPDTEEVESFKIQKPEIHQVEDDFVDTEALQKNIRDINNGKRLDHYEPHYEDELALDVPEDLELNDEVYTKVKAKDILKGTHLVYIGRDTCPFCQLLRVNLDPVVEQLDNKLKYISTDNKEDEQVLVKELGLTTVPQMVVVHDGEFVAQFPTEYMYMKQGADFTSLANGIGDLTNIYLEYKHDIDVEDPELSKESEESEESGKEESEESGKEESEESNTEDE